MGSEAGGRVTGRVPHDLAVRRQRQQALALGTAAGSCTRALGACRRGPGLQLKRIRHLPVVGILELDARPRRRCAGQRRRQAAALLALLSVIVTLIEVVLLALVLIIPVLLAAVLLLRLLWREEALEDAVEPAHLLGRRMGECVRVARESVMGSASEVPAVATRPQGRRGRTQVRKQILEI